MISKHFWKQEKSVNLTRTILLQKTCDKDFRKSGLLVHLEHIKAYGRGFGVSRYLDVSQGRAEHVRGEVRALCDLQ